MMEGAPLPATAAARTMPTMAKKIARGPRQRVANEVLGAGRLLWKNKAPGGEAWEKTIRQALKKADGRFDVAAKALDVAKRSLQRWASEIDARAAEAGRSGVERAPEGAAGHVPQEEV